MATNTQQPQPFFGEFGRKFMATLVSILLVYVIVLVGTMIRNNMQKYNTIGQVDSMPTTITVVGEGKVTVKPDVGTINLGFYTQADDLKAGIAKNNEIINKMVSGLKALGVAEGDIKTGGPQTNPRMTWNPDGSSTQNGYDINQNVTVKVRDLTKSQDIIGLAGESGANTVSPLTFDVDEPKNYEAQARQEAINEAYEKARVLTQQLGISIVRMSSYYETNNGGYPMYDYGYNAGMPMAKTMESTVEPGSQDVNVVVNIAFEVR